MIREILQYPDKRLTIVSTPLDVVNDETRVLLADMLETMVNANGIGLAAPQIGVHKEVIIIARSIIEEIEEENCEEEQEYLETLEDAGEIEEFEEFEEIEERELECLVIINPVLELFGEDIVYVEGCLSVPTLREEVVRKSKVRLTALDEYGMSFTLEAEGLLAVCIQHEMDHLAGKLFIDRISFLKRSMYDKKLAKGTL